MNIIAGSILVAFSLLGCAREPLSPAAPGVDIPLTRFTTEPSSFLHYSGFNTSARTIVGDRLTWRAVWDALYRRQSEIPPLPEVDFSKEEILVAALGERGSGGFSIVFQGASGNDSGGVDVVVKSGSPGNGCAALTVLTQPVDIARIPKVNGAVHFVERASVSNCGR